MTSMGRNLKEVAQICYDNGESWTNEELLQMAIRCALNLLDLGLREGDVIGVATKNEAILTPIVIAAFTLGLPINPVNSEYNVTDLLHMFRITQPKVVICCPENHQNIQIVLKEIGVFDEKGSHKPAIELLTIHTGEKLFVPPPIRDASALPALICCSSGTTGPSKGVLVSHNLLAYQCTSFGLKYGRVFFSFSTLDWLTGPLGLATCLLNGVTRVITKQPFTPQLMLQIIRTHQVNGIFSSPTLMTLLLRHKGLNSDDLQSVEEWIVGGSYVAKGICEEINGNLKNGRVHTAYGSSEVGGLIARTPEEYDSVGKLARGFSVKIVDDEGRQLGPNERGEVCIRCIVPMRGYYRNEKATKESFIDSWWYSGDVGIVDDKGVHTAYGSSEVGGLIARTAEEYDSVGKLARGISVKIVDDEGRQLGPNERGEVCIRCIVPMRGYYRNEKATKDSFIDSWWYSGDVGIVYDKGYLRVVDRKKDVIKFMGHSVDPSEIERLILTLPGVVLVGVIGIPDPVYVDLPAAVIQKTKDSTLSEEVVTELVESSLSNHKWLRGGVHFIDRMPLSHSGKVLKRQLRVRFEKRG